MKVIYISLLFHFLSFSVCAQNNSLVDLTQKSNFFISKTSSNKIFISSLDGMNIFDGLNVKKYLPATHNMYGNNIQSYFYEDQQNNIWFTTFEALHYYTPFIDSLSYTFLINPEGDTIKNDYKIIGQLGDTLIVGADRNTYLYNCRDFKTIQIQDLDLYDSNFQFIQSNREGYSLLATFGDQFLSISIDSNFVQTSIDTFSINAFSVHGINDQKCLIGTTDGSILILDLVLKKIEYQENIYPNKYLTGISKVNDSILLLNAAVPELYLFNVNAKKKIAKLNIKNAKKLKNHTGLINNYFDKDSILWAGTEGIGVVWRDLKKEKFRHLLYTSENDKTNKITGIISDENDQNIILSTRGNGIYLLNSDLDIEHHWKNIPYAFNLSWKNRNELIYTESNSIYKLNLLSKKSKKLFTTPDLKNITTCSQIDQDNYLISTTSPYLYHLDFKRNKIEKSFNTDHEEKITFVGLKIDSNKDVFVSANDQFIWKFKNENNAFTFEKSFNIPGGILSLSDTLFDASHWYISNQKGIYKIGKNSYNVDKVSHISDLLDQPIYCMIPDEKETLWLSSNRGIINYDRVQDSIRTFDLHDGMQDTEFNTNAFLKRKTGEILMGGINGLNAFTPSTINSSPTNATVCIDEVHVANKPTDKFGKADFVEHIKVDYGIPIAIFFHAVDYGNLEGAKLKYSLKPNDENFIVLKDYKESLRFPKLAPGEYNLLIKASNSDGVWNPIARKIKISIKPPFWMTLWFFGAILLLIFGLIYYFTSIFYNRKIERKNAVLREQALIIESQNALENERTRIASEMHDDLGSGLTRIKYLSDKVKLELIGSKTSDNIDKISYQSQSLIRNMGEIIWALNTRFDDIENLISYIRRYAFEYLEENDIALEFIDRTNTNNFKVSGIKRRNLFLIIKELLHNSVKHSKSKKLRITIDEIDTKFRIQILEINGQVFDVDEAREKGNGIYNMEKRIEGFGELEFQKSKEGMIISIII